jgi:hypothetical protein
MAVGHTAMAVGYAGITGRGAITGAVGIAGHGRISNETTGTAAPAGITRPKAIDGPVGIVHVRKALLTRCAPGAGGLR